MRYSTKQKYLSGDVISFNWVNDLKVEFHIFMQHTLSKIDAH